MSLLVWIPMVHGDCKDQGLLGVETSVVNTITYVDGKLGKAVQIGNGNQVTNGISINTNLVEELGTQYSCSVWVKPLGNHVHYEGAIISSGDWNKKCWAFGVNQDNSKVDIFCGGYNRNVTCSVPINQWTHLVSVNNGTYVNLYKNGELVSTTSASSWPLDSDATNTTIGRETYAGGYFSFNGCIQDLRIYDHALSPLEVKHLAQGLVLHYPLNRGGFGQDNLFTANPCYNGNRWTALGNGVKIDWTSNAGDTYWFLRLADGVTLTEGDTYTLSFQCSGIGSAAVSFNWCNITGYGVFLHNGLNTYTFEMPATNISNPFFDDINRDTTLSDLRLWNFKLEKGSVATPWTPAPSDALYSQMGLDNNIEYDVSGYGNNGELYAYDANGSITVESDTPRYNVSTHIASANSTTNAASGTRYIYGHCSLTNPTEMTVSFWLKPVSGGYGGTTSNGQGYFCTTNYEYGNANAGSDYQASAMNHRDGAVDINDSSSTTQCRPTFYPTIGEWHHYVITYDGQVGRVYKDGVQSSTAQFSSPKTLDSFIGVIIGFSKAGGVWRRNDACYSDFRIYATALSADDVMALYHTPIFLSNNGTLLTQGEFVES